MYARQLETPAGFLAIDRSLDVRELDSSEIREVTGGMMAAPLVAGLWVAGAMGGLAILGIVVGVAIYTYTHRH